MYCIATHKKANENLYSYHHNHLYYTLVIGHHDLGKDNNNNYLFALQQKMLAPAQKYVVP